MKLSTTLVVLSAILAVGTGSTVLAGGSTTKETLLAQSGFHLKTVTTQRQREQIEGPAGRAGVGDHVSTQVVLRLSDHAERSGLCRQTTAIRCLQAGTWFGREHPPGSTGDAGSSRYGF